MRGTLGFGLAGGQECARCGLASRFGRPRNRLARARARLRVCNCIDRLGSACRCSLRAGCSSALLLHLFHTNLRRACLSWRPTLDFPWLVYVCAAAAWPAAAARLGMYRPCIPVPPRLADAARLARVPVLAVCPLAGRHRRRHRHRRRARRRLRRRPTPRCHHLAAMSQRSLRRHAVTTSDTNHTQPQHSTDSPQTMCSPLSSLPLPPLTLPLDTYAAAGSSVSQRR